MSKMSYVFCNWLCNLSLLQYICRVDFLGGNQKQTKKQSWYPLGQISIMDMIGKVIVRSFFGVSWMNSMFHKECI